jgi:hypothetical protein
MSKLTNKLKTISYDEYLELIKSDHHFYDFYDLLDKAEIKAFVLTKIFRDNKNQIEFPAGYKINGRRTNILCYEPFFEKTEEFDIFVNQIKNLALNTMSKNNFRMEIIKKTDDKNYQVEFISTQGVEFISTLGDNYTLINDFMKIKAEIKIKKYEELMYNETARNKYALNLILMQDEYKIAQIINQKSLILV